MGRCRNHERYYAHEVSNDFKRRFLQLANGSAKDIFQLQSSSRKGSA